MKPLYSFLIITVVGLACSACGEEKKDSQQNDVEQVAADAFKETYRPQFHYSPPEMWMNDPNGLVYKDGVYSSVLPVLSGRYSMGAHALGSCSESGYGILGTFAHRALPG